MPIEPTLRANLLKLFDTYQETVGGAFATISDRVSGDARLYENLQAGALAFTARRYDLVVARFAECWPRDLPWPQEIERTALTEVTRRRRKGRAGAG